jgi:cold shock CspA family protein
MFPLEEIQVSVPRAEEDGIPEHRTGVVIFFNDAKGFGFINDVQTNRRIFVHVNSLSESVKESDKVMFEIEQGSRGPTAVKVKKIL